MKKAITEKQLILPALMVLASKQGYVTVKELKAELSKRVTLHKADKVKVSQGRVRFNNTVGNLVSHRTLADFAKHTITKDGKVLMRINRAGRQHLFKAMLKVA
jgi:hypothetical protein